MNNILNSTKLLFFTYFLSWGAFSPYISRYMSKTGLNGAEIGFLQGLTALLAFLMPPLWGFLADAKQWKKKMLLLSLYGMALGLILYYFSYSFVPLLIATIFYASANGPVIPLLDSIALEAAASSGSNYGQIRLYGSLGYAFLASLMPYIYNSSQNPGSIFPMALIFIILTIVLVTKLPESAVSTSFLQHNSYANMRFGFLTLFKNPAFCGLMLVAFLNRIAVVPYYNFFALYLEGLKANTFIVGYTWMVAILGEVVVLYNAEKLMAHLGERKLLILALLISALRWFIYANIRAPWLIFSLQWLHGFTFAAMHAVTVKLVNKIAPEGMQVSAQSVYAAVNLGLGGFIGSLLMGYLFDYFGGANTIVKTVSSLFIVSALLSLVALAIGLFGVKLVAKTAASKRASKEAAV